MQNASEGPSKPTLKTEPATQTEIFYCELGKELVKRELPFLNDVLRSLMTLNVSLLGGGIFFLSAGVCIPGLRMAAMMLFFLSLLFAFAGVLPKTEQAELFAPYLIQDAVKRITDWKTALLKGAAVFLILGLALAFLGVVLSPIP